MSCLCFLLRRVKRRSDANEISIAIFWSINDARWNGVDDQPSKSRSYELVIKKLSRNFEGLGMALI